MTTNAKVLKKFTYKDSSCTAEGSSNTEPVYSCLDKPAGFIPEETNANEGMPGGGILGVPRLKVSGGSVSIPSLLRP